MWIFLAFEGCLVGFRVLLNVLEWFEWQFSTVLRVSNSPAMLSLSNGVRPGIKSIQTDCFWLRFSYVLMKNRIPLIKKNNGRFFFGKNLWTLALWLCNGAGGQQLRSAERSQRPLGGFLRRRLAGHHEERLGRSLRGEERRKWRGGAGEVG